MSLVSVVQEKNINVVVGLYKKIRIEINKATDNPNIDKKNFLDLKKILNWLSNGLSELKSSRLLMKPLFLPIFKNLFFL